MMYIFGGLLFAFGCFFFAVGVFSQPQFMLLAVVSALVALWGLVLMVRRLNRANPRR